MKQSREIINPKNVKIMKKLIFVTYSLVCYFIFFATFLYMIGFVENITNYAWANQFKSLFPGTLDQGTASLPRSVAIIIDLLLIALFGLQHSIMARQTFKKKWSKLIPQPIERSTYVLFASLALIVMFIFWQPVKPAIWDFSQTTTGTVFFSLSMMGWLLLLISTYMINHFDLFGLRQAFLFAQNKEFKHIQFQTPGFYKVVRHPIYLSFLIIFWFAPVMTIGHLVFSAGMTTYILIGIYHEEKDLIKFFGNSYEKYRQQVPGLIPFSKNVGTQTEDTRPIETREQSQKQTTSTI
jgi:protein-S-isoprenylcysteine O-methyltransferase Ste14